MIVAGDLNAKHAAWGSRRTDPRGEALEEWASAAGLVVINTGSASTCIRRRGESVIDVTFATPSAARKIRGWNVLSGVETLSNHAYIAWSYGLPPSPGSEGRAEASEAPHHRLAGPWGN